MTNGTQSGSASNARPIVADVYATLVDGKVKFDHDWRFEGDPTGKKGIIDVPAGGPGTPPATIRFHLHDDTGLNLKFINPPRDAMWVSKAVRCPKKRGTGGQISYPHAWEADVLKVQDVTAEPTVEHELALVKVRVTEGNRGEVLKLIELTRGRVLDVSPEAVIAEVSGSEAEVDDFVACVRGFGIKELVRTGAVVMARGSGSIEEAVKR